VCAILTADCLPVLFAADCGETVGAAHAGWRGLAAGVMEATFQALRAAPDSTLVWLGPAIGPGHFEVGSEVREVFLRQDAGSSEAFKSASGGRFMADLGLLARRRLAKLGITRIYGGGECTYGSADRYFSYRRDGQCGRQATLIWRSER
jgi:YfiH family protein